MSLEVLVARLGENTQAQTLEASLSCFYSGHHTSILLPSGDSLQHGSGKFHIEVTKYLNLAEIHLGTKPQRALNSGIPIAPGATVSGATEVLQYP